MSEFDRNFIESLSLNQTDLLKKIRDFRLSVVSLDFDQIMALTEEPVKEEFFIQTGIDYRGRKIDQWLALSNWAAAEGKMSFNEAVAIEGPVWENSDILFDAKPITEIQKFSENLHKARIPQIVVSTRVPKLEDSTLEWIKINFPWIDSDSVFLRKDPKFNGDSFKGLTVAQNCADVHFDDSVSSAKSILNLSTSSVMLFPRKLELKMLNGDRVVEFESFEQWLEVQNLLKS